MILKKHLTIIALLLLSISLVSAQDKKEEKVPDLNKSTKEITKTNKIKNSEIPMYLKALKDHKQDDGLRNEIINLLRRNKVPSLNLVMIKGLENDKESIRFKSFLLQHLGVSIEIEKKHTE